MGAGYANTMTSTLVTERERHIGHPRVWWTALSSTIGSLSTGLVWIKCKLDRSVVPWPILGFRIESVAATIRSAKCGCSGGYATKVFKSALAVR
eukprot:1828954-Pleurochrysis_carterae.AAC.1